MREACAVLIPFHSGLMSGLSEGKLKGEKLVLIPFHSGLMSGQHSLCSHPWLGLNPLSFGAHVRTAPLFNN